MTPITKYLCDICRTIHDSEVVALACEAKGLPQETLNIKEGDVIEFEREETGAPGSSIVTYIKEKGKVLYKFAVKNDKKNCHQDIMVCECTDKTEGVEPVVIERGVLMVKLEKEGEQLFSPAEYTWKKGWAEVLRTNEKK